MNTTQTATRIHPLMAAAAVSVIVVSLTGAAAITGVLPSSRSAPEPQAALAPAAGMPLAAPAAAAQLHTVAALPTPAAAPLVVSAAPGTTTYVQAANTPSAPVVIVKQEAAPVVKRTVIAPKPRVIEHHTTRVVHVQEPSYRPAPAPAPIAPAPAPAQPSYVGIGTGAVIGGLIGNQIGGGNGKKLATLAGIIGGGYIGNKVANRNSQ